MKAFLSHSSLDKGFVETVAEYMRPGTYELDSGTFDAGLVNSEAITAALKRSDVFCLFLSKDSVRSTYVEFETLLGIEFLARGSIRRFVAICLDDEAFKQAAENVRFYNIVRKCSGPEQAARLIEGALIGAATSKNLSTHPFIGREQELIELEKQATDYRRPPSRALYISGNFGAGRRTVAKKFYSNQYPSVGETFPSIHLEPYAGLEELYRRVLRALRPSTTSGQLRLNTEAFAIAPMPEQLRLIAGLLNSLLPAREAAIIYDEGGLLSDDGSFLPEIDAVIQELEARPHPPVVFISNRMISARNRRKEDDLSYLGLRSLSRESSERLLSRLLKDGGHVITPDQMNELVSLGDGHPFNFYRIMEEIDLIGPAAFLANPQDFVEWKHKRSSEYVSRIEFSGPEISILSLLKLIPELDFSAISDALQMNTAEASSALLRLVHLHIVESQSDNFMVSPSIRVAVERDKRMVLRDDIRELAIAALASSLSVRLEEGTASIALVDSAVLAMIQSGSESDSLVAAFLLPSHYVWLCTGKYHAGEWSESIRLAQEALKSANRLSANGFVTACRYMCLSAARLGKADLFEEGIGRLENSVKDNWSKGNVAFLRGFNFRLKGNLPAAEQQLRKAISFSDNSSATRELAAILLARNNIPDAEAFARTAYSGGTRNPYLLDMLLSVLIKKHGRASKKVQEINDLFDILSEVGDEGGKSFYTTRKAELEHVAGDQKQALILIVRAREQTPYLFEPRRLHIEILLALGNKSRAFEMLVEMKAQLDDNSTRERRRNYREYLVTQSHYLEEVGQFTEAKRIYNDSSMFDEQERIAAIRNIEMTQGFNRR